MLRKTLCFIVVVVFLIPAAALATDLTGRQILDEQKRRHKTASEIEVQQMLLVDATGGKEKREVRRYSKEVEPDVYRSLLGFLSPRNIRGTALLTWQHKDQEDDQWLYMPARGKLQRIAKGGKRNYFMGTDFTYEDLRGEDLNAHIYNRLENTTYNDQKCFVVEALPATKEENRESGYSKRILWIRQDIFSTLKVEFYDKRGKLLKIQYSSGLENTEGEIWRARKGLMENIQRKHKTFVLSAGRQINVPIDDKTFTERFILQGLHIR